MTRYVCTIESDATHARTYDVDTSSALKCADKYGRCEGGETVTVSRLRSGRVVSRAIWTPQDGGRYINVCV